jgi:alanyl-tRNA synthetase
MKTHDVRKKFLDYFKKQGHALIPSSPVVPHDDPTLLFTNAGMNQFKDVFLGKTKRDYERAATSQKCIRAGGKHNDLDNVGHTTRHLTFFEMLGNFSFGNYFKEDAIRFAWEVSTEVFGLDPEKIYPTIFKDDDEAFELWKKFVPEKRISRMGEKTNFWMMGETGPCGPCSELLYDRGEKFGPAKNPLEDVGEERYFEYWNLVFMQYNRTLDGKILSLPKPSIDTGAGLERIADLKLGTNSVFETDILRGLIDQVEQISGIVYRIDSPQSAAFRVIADHIRSLAFAIADGAQPSNIERGYVLRKILRRAVRYGKSLGLNEPFLAKVLPRLIDLMGEDYIELKKSEQKIQEILTAEEETFLRTLNRGGNILGKIVEDAQKEKRKISGDEAFKLKDTYGLPLEEILLLAKDATLQVDLERYQALEQEAKERSKKVHKGQEQVASTSLFNDFEKTHTETQFTGYTHSEGEGKVVALVLNNTFVDKLCKGQEGMVILDKTPFYAEKGGQVGDTGSLQGQDSWFSVTDTQNPYKGVIAHIGKVEKGTIQVGDRLEGYVDLDRRKKIACNHSATHLLHFALIHVLGEHVRQAGSVVAPDRLRFDFNHHKPLSNEEIQEIEDLVNEKIRSNTPVAIYELPFEQVQKKGEIKQFFGDKYGDIVRVIDIDFSKELCGGIHVQATGSIGLFRITKEGSIAQGVRRIEAVTAKGAEEFAKTSQKTLEQIANILKAQSHLVVEKVEKLVTENKELLEQKKALQEKEILSLLGTLEKEVETIHGSYFVAAKLDLEADELKLLADALMDKKGRGLVILGSAKEGRCQVMVRAGKDFIDKGLGANDVIKAIAPIIQGGGGGKQDAAQAGGKSPEKLDEAFQKVRSLIS